MIYELINDVGVEYIYRVIHLDSLPYSLFGYVRISYVVLKSTVFHIDLIFTDLAEYEVMQRIVFVDYTV